MSRLQENTTANQHWKNKHVSQSLSSVESGCCGEIQSSNIPFNRPYVHNTLRVCSPINISRLVCVSCSCLLLVSCTLFFIIVVFFFFPLPAIFSFSLQCCLSCLLHFSHLSFSRELVALNSSVAQFTVSRRRLQISSLLSHLSSQTNVRLSFFFCCCCCDSRRISSLSAVQDLDEGFAKLDVESGVDDGVDGAVEVSQPGDGAVE